MLTRRDLLAAAAVSAGFLGARRLFAGAPATLPAAAGYGPLLPDPAGLFDVPAGFSYRIFSRTGQVMDDQLRVPGKHDGMAAFAGPNGSTLLVRNHELSADLGAADAFGFNKELLRRVSPGKFYDFGFGKNPCPGGTTKHARSDARTPLPFASGHAAQLRRRADAVGKLGDVRRNGHPRQ